ncbi:MAG: peptidylprolyl isomerase [Owenweeksia sp.]|nr:peptidylprolyl isomerase [Owenweeksia sp.]
MPDDEVTVEESDLRDYYENNKEDFESEKLADIQYVNFPISASTSDLNEIKEELKSYLEPEYLTRRGVTDTMPAFSAAEEDSLFAASRSDERVQPNYYKKDALPTGLDSTLFEKEIGYVAGPYRANGFFRLSKIADKKIIPDSVNARHILLSFREIENGNQNRGFEEAKAMADSLLEVVRKDTAQFAKIARKLSDDPGSGAKGGDLGWFNDQAMVRPFSNFAFRNEIGDIGMVPSQFGFHIIEIQEQAGGSEALKLINISREIQPGDATLDSIYNKASSFAASVKSIEEFGSIAEDKSYQPRPVTGLKPFDENVIGIGNNRDIVKWAHNEETEIGDIQVFNNGEASYVVVMLTDAASEGYRPLEAVTESIRPKVINELKAKKIMEQFAAAAKGQDNLQAVAQELGLGITTQTLNFGATNLNQLGKEPEVIGVMTALEPNVLSEPVKGQRGVYLIQVASRTPARELPSYQQQQEQQEQTRQSRVANQVFISLRENAQIEDRRTKFYQ